MKPSLADIEKMAAGQADRLVGMYGEMLAQKGFTAPPLSPAQRAWIKCVAMSAFFSGASVMHKSTKEGHDMSAIEESSGYQAAEKKFGPITFFPE